MAGNNILVVDDDNKTVSKIVDVLESEGYAVFAASSKASAVELCTKTRPSLIYVNAILTDASGLEITRAIRGLDFMKTVPIVMLTEMEEEFSERYKSTYGIIGFLKKPIDTNDLVKKTTALVSLESSIAGSGGETEDAFSALGLEKTEPKEIPEPEEPVTPPGAVQEAMEFDESGREAKGVPEPQSMPSFTEPEPAEDVGAMAFKSFEESEEVEVVERSFSDEPLDETIEVQEKPTFGMKETETPSFEPPVEEGLDDFDAESLFAAKDNFAGSMAGEDFSGYEDMAMEGKKSRKSLVINIIIAVVAVSALAAVAYMWFFMDFSEEVPKRPVQQAVVPSQTKPLTPQPQASQQPAVPPAEAKPVVPPQEEKPSVSLPVVQKPEQPAQPAETQKPVSAKAEKPKSAPSSRRGLYSVQVGYFGVRENAYNLQDALKKKNYDVFIETVKKRSGTGYRVLIGSYRTQDEALKDMKRIKSREGIEVSVYRRKR